MDSTLGKILSSLLVLVALALVVVFGGGALSRHSTNDLVGGISAMAASIQGDYANNPAGYGTLSNATVIAAGEVPVNLLKNNQIVSPWGNPVTVSPLPGSAKNFQIDLGAVPAQNCVDLLVHTAGLAGAVVSGTQVPLPIDPASAATQCKASGDLTLQFGSKMVPIGLTIPATGWQPIPTTWLNTEQIYQVLITGNAGMVGKRPAYQILLQNNNNNPVSFTVNWSNRDSILGQSASTIYLNRELYVNGVKVGNCALTNGQLCSNTITLNPGQNSVNFVDPAVTSATSGYQTVLYAATPNEPSGVTLFGTSYISSWTQQFLQ